LLTIPQDYNFNKTDRLLNVIYAKELITLWKRSNVTLEHYVPYTVTLPKVGLSVNNQWQPADYLE